MKQFISLKVLVWLAGVAFGFMLISYVFNEFDDIKLGFIAGQCQYEYEHLDSVQSENFTVDGMPADQVEAMAMRVYFLTLKQKESVFNFPDSVLNLKSGASISTRNYEVKARLPLAQDIPQNVILYDWFCGFLSFLIAGSYIFLIYNFILLFIALQREVVFDRINIIRLKKIGFSFILVFMFMSVFNYLSFLMNDELFQFANYDILWVKADISNLFMGFGIMIIAEILNRGFKLKQENELTV